MPSSPRDRLRPPMYMASRNSAELSVVINIIYVSRKFLTESLPHDMHFPVEAVPVVIQKLGREEPRSREFDSVGVTDCRD